jgi:hypothetical protein
LPREKAKAWLAHSKGVTTERGFSESYENPVVPLNGCDSDASRRLPAVFAYVYVVTFPSGSVIVRRRPSASNVHATAPPG